MKKLLLLPALFLVFIPAIAQKPTSNVLIEEINDVYKFVPVKDGENLARVEHTSQITFRANRVADDAVAMAYYTDDIKIDKVKADNTVYGSYFGDAFFSDSKACLMSAELKKAGATAKISFRRTYTRPEFFTKVFLPNIYYINKGTVKFEIPKSLAGRFNIIEKNISSESVHRSEERIDGNLVITYTLTQLPEIQTSDDAPSINITAPQLHILGHFKDTDDLYRYLRAYTIFEDPGAAAVQDKAQEITADCRTDAERISAITDYVHNTVRYVAVEHGEFGHKPDLPSEVLRKAYGDCKGSAVLIKAMLVASGIDAKLVWVGTDDIAERWTDEPNISSGNHMIAAAMTGDSILFIDGTAKFNPAGTIPTGIQGRQAMVEDTPDKCIVATIPIYSPESNSRVDSLSLTIDSSGNMRADGTVTLTGAYMRSFQSLLADTPPARHSEKYMNLFDTAFPGSRSADVSFGQNNESITFSGSSQISGAVKISGDEMYVDLNPDKGLPDMKFKTEGRNFSGRLSMRRVIESVLTLNIPDHAQISDIPSPVSIDNRWVSGFVTTEASSDGHSVVRRYRLIVKDPVVPLGNIKKYNSDIQRLNRGCTAKIVMKSK